MVRRKKREPNRIGLDQIGFKGLIREDVLGKDGLVKPGRGTGPRPY
jgi:hypothetical protein